MPAEYGDVVLCPAHSYGWRRHDGLLTGKLHTVRGQTRVRSLHGYQHNHMQRNVLHTGKTPESLSRATVNTLVSHVILNVF